jgi:hypothetical protein
MSILNRNGPRTSRRAATTFFTWQLALLAHAGFASTALASPAPTPQVLQAMQSLAVPFEANSGQFDPGVAFMARTFAGAVFVTHQGQIVYSLPGPVSESSERARMNPARDAVLTRQPGWRLMETLVGAQPLVPQGGQAAQVQVRHFTGPRSYHAATYHNVQLGQAWPGVSVELAARGSNVEKLFHVGPHADATQIQVRLDGALSLRLGEEGELIAATGRGDVAYTPPVAFQQAQGGRVDVPVRYALNAAGDGYSFTVGAYDASLPLVIDPLLRSTYVGGNGKDSINALAIDSQTGDVLVAGYTQSPDFPGVAGGGRVGGWDGFVSRLSADLKTIKHSMYLGGSALDIIKALAIDPKTGDVLVAGITESTDFHGAVGSAPSGRNAFVARLSGDLAASRSIYLGGSGRDDANALVIMDNGDVVVAGATSSADFPLTVSGSSYGGGGDWWGDGFVARLSGDLVLKRSIYLGGRESDTVNALAVDASRTGRGDLLVAGFTASSDFPLVQGGQQERLGRFEGAGFISRLSSDLAIAQSTYLGAGDDSQSWVQALAINARTGDIAVISETYSGTFPGTASDVQHDHDHEPETTVSTDVVVSRLPGSLTAPPNSIYVEGSGSTGAKALAITAAGTDDELDEIVVAGSTSSKNLAGSDMGMPRPHPKYGGGFVARFALPVQGDLTLKRSTYLGEKGWWTYVGAMAIDSMGRVVVGGGADEYLIGAEGTLIGRRDGYVSRIAGDLRSTSTQKIAFPQQGAQRFDQGSFDVHPPAVASSELPVHYGVLPASRNVCAIPDGRVGKVTILGVGTCAVVASQPGDGGIGWLAAGDVVRDIRIVR